MLSQLATRSILCAGSVLASAHVAGAQLTTVTLGADRDTTIYQDPFGMTSNGAGQYLFAGKTLRGGQDRRAFLRFNVNSVVPAGATIVSAELRLHCSRNNSNATNAEIRRALAGWGEGASNAGEPGGSGTDALPGDATWLHASFPNVLWANVGGDFSSTVSATAPILDGGLAVGPVTFASTPGTVADVQSWLNAPASNFGWALLSPDVNGSTAHRFDSRENSNPDFRPALVIQFRPPCRPDFNGQNGVTVQDIFDFLGAWFANDPRADFNAQNGITVQDIFDFLAAWFAGCP